MTRPRAAAGGARSRRRGAAALDSSASSRARCLPARPETTSRPRRRRKKRAHVQHLDAQERRPGQLRHPLVVPQHVSGDGELAATTCSGVDEVAGRPATDERMERDVGRVVDPAEVLVRVGVSSLRDRGAPTRELHEREHRIRAHRQQYALGSSGELLGRLRIPALGDHRGLGEQRRRSPPRLPGLVCEARPSAAAGVATRASATCTAAHADDTSACASSPRRPCARKPSTAAARNGSPRLCATRSWLRFRACTSPADRRARRLPGGEALEHEASSIDRIRERENGESQRLALGRRETLGDGDHSLTRGLVSGFPHQHRIATVASAEGLIRLSASPSSSARSTKADTSRDPTSGSRASRAGRPRASGSDDPGRASALPARSEGDVVVPDLVLEPAAPMRSVARWGVWFVSEQLAAMRRCRRWRPAPACPRRCFSSSSRPSSSGATRAAARCQTLRSGSSVVCCCQRGVRRCRSASDACW